MASFKFFDPEKMGSRFFFFYLRNCDNFRIIDMAGSFLVLRRIGMSRFIIFAKVYICFKQVQDA